MSLDLSLDTAQKKNLADLLRSIAKLIEDSGNNRVSLKMDLDFIKDKKKKD